MPLLLSVALASAHLSSAFDACADAAAAEKADRLFKEANDLAVAGKYAEACPKLEESFQLDPGLGTQFNLADCYEHTKRPATAWKLFLEVARTAAIAGKKPREESSRARAAALEPRVPMITLTLGDPSPPADLEIKRNGVVVPRAEWGKSIAVDLGTSTFEATAAGRLPWKSDVEIAAEGKRVELVVPALVAEKKAEAPAPVVVAPTAPADRPEHSSARTAGFVVGAVGVVSLVASGVLALRAKSLQNLANRSCPETACSDPDAVDKNASARSTATWATVAGGVGIAAVGVGLVLILTAPSESKAKGITLKTSPVVGPTGVGWTLQGVF